LGKVEIPLSSILNNSVNLDALFLVKRPFILFGYNISKEDVLAMGS
jgi:hypothetical protein